MQRGQTIQAKLTLGDSSKALLIPNGAFFNDTGGNWVFVVDRSGNSATKRQVQLGRRNADFIEVLGGLSARRARDHLFLQRADRQGPPDLQLRRVRKEHHPC